MEKIYHVLHEIENGTKSVKELFIKVETLFNNDLVEFQKLLNNLESQVYIRFVDGNSPPNYGNIIFTDKGRDYLKKLKPRYGISDFVGPCNQFGKVKCKEYFVTNFDDLCDTCWIREKVADIRANMIKKFETLKAINSKEYIVEYLKKENEHDNKIIEDMLNIENQGWVEFRDNRVGFYHSYIDCVKYQTEQLKIVESEINKEAENMKTTAKNNGANITNTLPDVPLTDLYFMGQRFILRTKDENGIFQVIVKDGNKKYVATAKSESAKQEFADWYWNVYNTDERRTSSDVNKLNSNERKARNQLGVMLNDSRKFDLPDPPKRIDLLLLKKAFDKIQSYPDKLKWWGEKDFYLNCGHTLVLTNFGSENANEENRLTIFPSTPNEISLFNEFCFKEHSTGPFMLNNLELLKEKYFERLKKGANGIEFIKREIEKQKSRYDEAKKSNKDNCNDNRNSAFYDFFVTGFDASTDGAINDILKNRFRTEKLMDLVQGYAAEQYLRFLDNQLKEFEQGTTLTILTPQIEAKPVLEAKQVPLNFDYSNGNNYFFNDKIETFKKIEEELISKEYMDAKGTWNKERRYLVALIHIMYNLKYMRPKINGKSEKNTKLDYRRFFEKRYNTNVTQEMKPSKFPANKLKDYKYDFHFIPEIEKI